MKKLCFIILALAAVTKIAKAQNSNPWPTSGYVGIGTTTPADPLTVIGNISIGSKLYNGVSNNSAGIEFTKGGVGSVVNISGYNGIIFNSSTAGIGAQTERMRITNEGQVGIGTVAPNTPLHITRSSTPNTDVPLQRWDSGLAAYNLTLTNYNSTWGIDYHFNQFHNNTLLPVMAFQAGRVGIGTINPDAAFKLSVLGAIRATEIKVETGWSDYVFDKAYKLRPIAEVEAYIKQNHHLPDVPSAAEVEKNGVKLGETSSLLLKKIEELTLYLIEKDKQLINQQKKIEEQESRLSALEGSLKKTVK